MKKAILTLGVAFFAFTGVFAQVETETMQKEEESATQIEDNANLETQSAEDALAEPADAAQAGKVNITYDELPEPVKSQYQETEVTEAYKVEADPATGSADTKFEVHVQDAATAEAKIITFDENGEELKSSDAGSE